MNLSSPSLDNEKIKSYEISRSSSSLGTQDNNRNPIPEARPGAYHIPGIFFGHPSRLSIGAQYDSTAAMQSTRTSTIAERGVSIAADGFLAPPQCQGENQEDSQGPDAMEEPVEAAVVVHSSSEPIEVTVAAKDNWGIDFRNRRFQLALALAGLAVVALALGLLLSSSGGGRSNDAKEHREHPSSVSPTDSSSNPPTQTPTALVWSWKEVGSDIDGPSANAEFGTSMSLSDDGNRLVIGAINFFPKGGIADGTYVRVYEFRGGDWILLGSEILRSHAARFGYAVAISGDGNRIAAGSVRSHDGTTTGQVEVFELHSNSWELLGSPVVGGEDDDDYRVESSFSFSRNGSIIAVGSGGYTVGDISIGRVRIFEFSDKNWSQIGTIVGDANVRQFGRAVSLSNDGHVVAVGAPKDTNGMGHVRVYSYESSSWVQMGQDLVGQVAFDNFGLGVSLSADGAFVAVAAPWTGENGERSGQVRVYQYDIGRNVWAQLGDEINGKAAGDEFGYDISLSADGGTVIVGAPFHHGNGFRSGQARVYTLEKKMWQQVGGNLDGQEIADAFGSTVSLSADGDRVAVGAPFNDDNGSRSGRVQVFELHGYSTTNFPTKSPTKAVASTSFRTNTPTPKP